MLLSFRTVARGRGRFFSCGSLTVPVSQCSPVYPDAHTQKVSFVCISKKTFGVVKARVTAAEILIKKQSSI